MAGAHGEGARSSAAHKTPWVCRASVASSSSPWSGPEGSGPDVPRRNDPNRQGDLVTQTERRVKRPRKFKVILYNDDYTPMEFVVQVLESVFQKSPAEATQLMLEIHRSGLGVAGVYVLELAETKVVTVHQLAEQAGYPLRAGVEEE